MEQNLFIANTSMPISHERYRVLPWTAFSESARRAALVQELFRTTVPDVQNPLEVISRLQSVHSQLVTGGESISDSLLAYAMMLALPDSWTTQKQALWMEQHLSSEKVASAIREHTQTRNALLKAVHHLRHSSRNERARQTLLKQSHNLPFNNLPLLPLLLNWQTLTTTRMDPLSTLISTTSQATINSSSILAHLTMWSTLLLYLPIYNRYHL